MDMPAQRLSRRLERTLIAFCLLAALFGIVVYITTPSIYIDMLFLQPSPTDGYPLPVTLIERDGTSPRHLLKRSVLTYNTGEMFSLVYAKPIVRLRNTVEQAGYICIHCRVSAGKF